MKTIYLVTADTMYEGFTCVKAFGVESKAIAFRDRCIKHTSQLPQQPESLAGDKWNEKDYREWDKKHLSWKNRCPAGPDSAGCDYSIQKLKFEP